MELLGMYTYYDKKSGQYDTPFFCINDVQAERKFLMDIKREDSIIAQFKDDFQIVKVGTFNVLKGSVKPITIQTIREGLQITETQENSNKENK